MEVEQGPGRGAEQVPKTRRQALKELLALAVGSQETAKLMGHGKEGTATGWLCL